MRRWAAVIGSAAFFIAVPLVVGGVIPGLLTGWQRQPTILDIAPIRLAGIALILAGLPVLIDSFARFALEGLGTPAPVAPTRHLVVTGFYRHVRNPMYVAVLAVILGQALLFADVRLLAYGLAFWLACHLFVVFYEEPTLHRSFGADYLAFRANVPRWIPRLRPWSQQ
jgi:protein-S-isoprenylcysteine O-methyltransferase Ste14